CHDLVDGVSAELSHRLIGQYVGDHLFADDSRPRDGTGVGSLEEGLGGLLGVDVHRVERLHDGGYRLHRRSNPEDAADSHPSFGAAGPQRVADEITSVVIDLVVGLAASVASLAETFADL